MTFFLNMQELLYWSYDYFYIIFILNMIDKTLQPSATVDKQVFYGLRVILLLQSLRPRLLRITHTH